MPVKVKSAETLEYNPAGCNVADDPLAAVDGFSNETLPLQPTASFRAAGARHVAPSRQSRFD